MARASTKENKNIYQQLREEQKWSRDKASQELGTIPPERIERIESGRFNAHPDEVVLMTEKYKAPQLCNYYCANECEIGRQHVPEVRIKDLAQIVLEMLSSLNSAKRNQERLIDITADGVIENDEIDDFIGIQDNLEKISLTVEALRLWSEKMLADGKIDLDAYKEAKKRKQDVEVH